MNLARTLLATGVAVVLTMSAIGHVVKAADNYTPAELTAMYGLMNVTDIYGEPSDKVSEICDAQVENRSSIVKMATCLSANIILENIRGK